MPSLKTDTAMEKLALTLAESYQAWGEAESAHHAAANFAAGLAWGALEEEELPEVDTSHSEAIEATLKNTQTALATAQKALFEKAQKMNAELFPAPSAYQYWTRRETSEATLTAMLNTYVAEVAANHGLAVPATTDFFPKQPTIQRG